MDGAETKEVALVEATEFGEFSETPAGIYVFAARPAGHQEGGQHGGQEDAGPEAGLGGNVADVLAADEVVCNAPGKGPEGEKSQQTATPGQESGCGVRPAF